MHTLKQLQSGGLAGITRLKISENLTEFPAEILDLAASLEILDLSQNRLSQLPDSFSRLKNLKILFLSDNDFTEIPAVLGTLPALEMLGFKANKIASVPPASLPLTLRWLILTDNQIPEMPVTIGNCKNLQKLMLAGNKLTALPQELAACQNLELLRISANNFAAFPDWLFRMPKLSWLALAGNPATDGPAQTEPLPEIPWQHLQLEKQLGQGASGIIYRAILNAEKGFSESKPVAVKIFKGHVTSDGFPADEMKACLAAGNHPNLVKVLGKLADHPEQKTGLVLELIPPVYKNLGNPPSFQTGTRDTYPDGTVFTLKSLLSIASGIASAAAHLHARGIMHGDLYAHNILTSAAEEPLFGDFGAATLYRNQPETLALNPEKLEVRAFGCLLQDLLQHLHAEEKATATAAETEALQLACMQENVTARPDFRTIVRKLEAISTGSPEKAVTVK